MQTLTRRCRFSVADLLTYIPAEHTRAGSNLKTIQAPVGHCGGQVKILRASADRCCGGSQARLSSSAQSATPASLWSGRDSGSVGVCGSDTPQPPSESESVSLLSRGGRRTASMRWATQRKYHSARTSIQRLRAVRIPSAKLNRSRMCQAQEMATHRPCPRRGPST